MAATEQPTYLRELFLQHQRVRDQRALVPRVSVEHFLVQPLRQLELPHLVPRYSKPVIVAPLQYPFTHVST